jgi:hypothetical protein
MMNMTIENVVQKATMMMTNCVMGEKLLWLLWICRWLCDIKISKKIPSCGCANKGSYG